MVHSVKIHIIKANHRMTHARCKVVGVDRGGVGAKHRRCFFYGRDQIIKNIALKYTVLLFWREIFQQNVIINMKLNSERLTVQLGWTVKYYSSPQPYGQPFWVQFLQAFAFADQNLPGSCTFDLSVGPF